VSELRRTHDLDGLRAGPAWDIQLPACPSPRLPGVWEGVRGEPICAPGPAAAARLSGDLGQTERVAAAGRSGEGWIMRELLTEEVSLPFSRPIYPMNYPT
jgi:hypothetical protein